MSRKSGYRFSEKDMRQRMNLERIPIQSKRDTLLRCSAVLLGVLLRRVLVMLGGVQRMAVGDA